MRALSGNSFSRSARLLSALAVCMLLRSAAVWGQVGGDRIDYPRYQGQEEKEKPVKPRRSLFLRPAKKTPAEQLAYADGLAKSRPKRAMKQYRALVMRWPDSAQAARAQLAYAKLLRERGKLPQAFEAYKVLFERYPGLFAHYDEVLEEEFQIAREVMEQLHGHFLFLHGYKSPERAIPMLESIIENGPQWERAAEAQYLIGRIHEETKDYEEAIVAYETGLHRYPDSPFAEKCAYGRAYCLYLIAQESPYDLQAAKLARGALVLYIRSYPKAENVDIAKGYAETLLRRIARAAYEKARFYERIARKPAAALAAYREFVRSFPNSEWTGVAEIRIDALSQTVKEEDEE